MKPGDSVAIDPAMSCHECDQCLAGRNHTCRKIRFLGCPGQADGCLREYIVMPEECCFKLNDGLNLTQGAISEPLSIGVYSVKKSGDIKGANVGILGFGPIGMSVMLGAKALGANKFYVTDKIDSRLAIAANEGASLSVNPLKDDIVKNILKKEPLGMDAVFECCGQQDALDQAIELLKPGGRLIIVGIPDFDNWIISTEKIRHKEITLLAVRRQVNCVKTTLDLMKNGVINIDRMITHRFPFERTREAFDIVSGYKDGVMKAMIDF